MARDDCCKQCPTFEQCVLAEDLIEDRRMAQNAVVDNIDPYGVARGLKPKHCPYCAGVEPPCALHRR